VQRSIKRLRNAGTRLFASICNQKRIRAHCAQLFASRRPWRLLCMRFRRSRDAIGESNPSLCRVAFRKNAARFFKRFYSILSAISAIKSTRDQTRATTRKCDVLVQERCFEFSENRESRGSIIPRSFTALRSNSGQIYFNPQQCPRENRSLNDDDLADCSVNARCVGDRVRTRHFANIVRTGRSIVKFAFLMAQRARTRASFSMNALVARVYQGSLFPFFSIFLPHATVPHDAAASALSFASHLSLIVTPC